jgi:hypothetical protein
MIMKRIYYLLMLLPLLALQSCLHEQEDVFSESSSARMEAAIKEYRGVLETANTQWLLEYYPDNEQAYGGYAYIVSFAKDNVTAYFELTPDEFKDDEGNPLPLTYTVSSLYNIVPTQGPVLSFDTYNMFLHFFATPSSSAYQGYKGDYEFALKSISADQSEISLKGTRTGNYMKMRKLTQSPEEYLTAIRAVPTKFKSSTFLLKAGGVEVDCEIDFDSRQFLYQGADESNAIVTKQMAFCLRENGISLFKPLEIAGVTINEFTLREDDLVSDKGDATLTYTYPPLPPIVEQFTSAKAFWFLAYSQMSPSGQSLWDTAKEKFFTPNKETVEYAFFGVEQGFYGLVLYLSTRLLIVTLDNIELLAEDRIKITYNSFASTDNTFFSAAMKEAQGLVSFLEPFGLGKTSRTFKLEDANPIPGKAASQIKFTDESDATNWFIVTKTEISYPYDK